MALLDTQPNQVKAASAMLIACIVKTIVETDATFGDRLIHNLDHAYANNRDRLGNDFLELITWTRELVKAGNLEVPRAATE